MDHRVRQLAERTRGQLIERGDDAYDGARRMFNGMLDRRPALIFQPLTLGDVVAAVRWAAEGDLPIAVRGGGHGVAGYAMPDGAFVIDLGLMRSVSVEADGSTAEADGGCRLMDLDAATTGHGRAVSSGTFVDTGIGGLTLGGGIGYLIASEGFACDALMGAQLVTADGSVIEVDEEREPDLLWALRGGGGNFGIVTRFRYRLTEVGAIYGGRLRYRGEGVRDVLTRMFELDRAAPDELVLFADAWWSVAEDEPALTVFVAWRGDAETGQAALAGLDRHPALYQANLRPMSYLEVQALNTPVPFGYRHYWKGHFVRETPPALADAIVAASRDAIEEGEVLVELIHGQANRIPAETAAFGNRSARANVTALAIWESPENDAASVDWGRRSAASFEPYSLRGGGYLNYAEVDQTAGRVAAAYGAESYARLQQIKARVDPHNRFRFNGNIVPA
jgi:FAD/FMN-containing dehydrogenase